MNIGRKQWRVEDAGNGKYTHTQSVPRDIQDGWSLWQGSDAILTVVSVAPPLIKLIRYERREDAVGGGGSRQWQTHTNTHTHSVPVIHRVIEPRAMIRSNLDTRRRGPLLIKLMVYEHREDAVGSRGSRQCQMHTHTHTH